MQARSALFDLYGDHLRTRGRRRRPSPRSSGCWRRLDIAAPAVRTAVSRMVRQGWLEPVSTDAGPRLRGSPSGRRAGSTRRRRASTGCAPLEAWDGRWSIALLEHTPNRTTRERVQRALEYLGYRQAARPTAGSRPRPAPELESVTAAEGVVVTRFLGELDGDDARAGASGCGSRGRSPRPTVRWLERRAAAGVGGAGPAPDEQAAFAVRSTLLHEWRKFLFPDPGLPKELLPPDWPGQAAADYFDAESARLLPAASAYVDHCLQRRDP